MLVFAVLIAVMNARPELVFKPASLKATVRESFRAVISTNSPRFVGFGQIRTNSFTSGGPFRFCGVPVGFQLVGRHLAEGLLLRAGHAYQKVTDWHTRHPKLEGAEAKRPVAA